MQHAGILRIITCNHPYLQNIGCEVLCLHIYIQPAYVSKLLHRVYCAHGAHGEMVTPVNLKSLKWMQHYEDCMRNCVISVRVRNC